MNEGPSAKAKAAGLAIPTYIIAQGLQGMSGIGILDQRLGPDLSECWPCLNGRIHAREKRSLKLTASPLGKTTSRKNVA